MDDLEKFRAAIAEHKTIRAAARGLGVSEARIRRRLKGVPSVLEMHSDASDTQVQGPDLQMDLLKAEVRGLRAAAAAAKAQTLDQEMIKQHIVKLANLPVDPPDWLITNKVAKGSPGVPTLFASDWHWGEIVDETQIGGVNSFGMEIAQLRAKRMITATLDLLNNHLVSPKYPGIVFALGGDMVSGDIHEELMATNETEIMPVVMDLFGVLSWCIATLADQFGKVFVPCVSGNHGRNTHKIRAKGRNHTSFDWLLYCFLAKRFEADKRVSFLIPNGPDALYRVYNTTYLLTHGDQFRGGDGMIGALGPIIRGDHRKRSRQGQIGGGYDVMLLGHWHQLIQLERLIVNGSLKGYDEYAYANNFGFELPRQALWLTHPQHGITFRMPVNVDEPKPQQRGSWVSWNN